jgi:general secretion pathway protein C
MKQRIVCKFLLIVLMLYFGTSAVPNVCSAATEAGPLPPPVREDVTVKRVPLATQEIGLKLIGTVVANDPEESLAIIEDRTTGKQYPRREGDRVGKALIKKILRNEVIINAGRGDRKLTMLHEQPSVTQPASIRTSEPLPPPTAVTTSSLDRQEIDAAMPEYMQFMRTVRIRPHFEGGQPGGFMIYNIDPGSIFSKMGLENGDVIRAVNGEPIKTTQQALAFYNGLKTGRSVAVDVQRGESARVLRVEIRGEESPASSDRDVPAVQETPTMHEKTDRPGA